MLGKVNEKNTAILRLSKIAIECEIAFLELRLFLKNHLLEF